MVIKLILTLLFVLCVTGCTYEGNSWYAGLLGDPYAGLYMACNDADAKAKIYHCLEPYIPSGPNVVVIER
jgi:hypothetical protein